MIYVVLLVIFLLLFIYILKIRENEYISSLNDVLDSLKDNRELEEVEYQVKDKYEELFKSLRRQKNELDNSLDELTNYRKELEVTYNSLVKKSTQLEYVNQSLERKVANLSNLNALARTVLSVVELEKTVDIILDAYFVLTGAKRIALYLWEGGELKLTKTKGNIRFKGEMFFTEEEKERFSQEDYIKIYNNLSYQFNLVEEETIISSPLVVKDKNLGVIFVIEDKLKLINIDEETISALVIQISIAINNAKIYSDLLIKERMGKELELASRMQKRIIPQDLNFVFGLEVANYFEPAKEIGGDYYDYYIHKNESFYVTMADVSGKGMPAAFIMAVARSILRTLSTRGLEVDKDLKDLNRIIYPDITEDMFITTMHCKYDPKTQMFSFSNAGHNPMLIYRAATNSIELLTVKGVAIGFIKDYNYISNQTKLNKGDIVLLYTDGITEAENGRKELYGIDRLKDVLFQNRNNSAEEIKGSILDAIDVFKEDYEQVDDLTFVVLKKVD